jgi:hypothetical protein
MSEDKMTIEGEPSKQYRVSYGGQLLGSWSTAEEALKEYETHNKLIRPATDPKKKWRYAIVDGRTKEIPIAELRRRAKAEK